MDALPLTAITTALVGGAALLWAWPRKRKLAPGEEIPPTAPNAHPLVGHLKVMSRQDVHRPVVEVRCGDRGLRHPLPSQNAPTTWGRPRRQASTGRLKA